MSDRVEFWFDPVSPWCWAASRWILLVEEERQIDLTFRIMSLSLLNEGVTLPVKVRKIVDESWPYLRVLYVCDREFGQQSLRNLYSAIGREIHGADVAKHQSEIIEASIDSCGLPATLAEASRDENLDELIHVSHVARADEATSESGAPTIRINGSSFFGPALSRVPDKDKAVELYEAIRTAVAYPHFFQFQRARTEVPEFSS